MVQTAVKLILVTQSLGYVHDVVKHDAGPSRVQRTLEQIGKESGFFTVETIEDVKLLTPQKLREARLIVFYTTGELPFTDEQYDAFENWIKSGGGLLGIHCATDTLANHPRYPKLIGATFDSHPWGQDQTVTVKVHDASWAACKPFAPESALQEEIYQFKDFEPTQVRVLISLDMEKTALKYPIHIPIAWAKNYGQGKVFYTSLGHRDETWASPKFQAHLLGALQWLLDLDKQDATPNPELSATEENRARRSVAATQPSRL
jgi:type 1 glutamine amidotransferase